MDNTGEFETNYGCDFLCSCYYSQFKLLKCDCQKMAHKAKKTKSRVPEIKESMCLTILTDDNDSYHSLMRLYSLDCLLDFRHG